MKCKQCNSEIPDDSMFCEHCGTKIVPNSRIGKWPAILIIAGIALAVGIGIIIGKMSNKNTNSNTDVAAVDTVAYESTHETFAEVDEDMIDRKNNSGFEKGTTWSYTDRSSGVKTYFVFTTETDVIWLLGTALGNVFPVGFGKYNPSVGTMRFSASDKLHKGIAIYYGEEAVVFNINQNKKTAVYKIGDEWLNRFYNGGKEFSLSKEKHSLLPNRKLVGSRWKYKYEDEEGKIYFKTWNEAVLSGDEDPNRSVAYVCIGDMVSIKSDDNLSDENLIGSIYNGNVATLCREGLDKEKSGFVCVTIFKEE